MRPTPLLVLFIAIGSSLPASAGSDNPKALLRQGNDLFAAGDYQAAFEAFKSGHERSPTPVFLRSMAFCKLKMYQHKEAQKLLQEYLAKYPQAKDREKIGSTLADLEIVVATKVAVTSTPPGAEVYIDTEAEGVRGRTPYAGTIEPGEHTIIVRLSGYQTATKTVTIRPKQQAELALALKVPLEIISRPAGATVHVDSATAPPLGKTPITAGLAPGEHTVYLKREGFKTYSTQVTAAAGKGLSLSAELLVGLMIETNPKGATITLDGKVQPGQSPLEVTAVPGPHRLELSLTGFKKVAREITLAPGKNPPLSTTMPGGLLSMRTDLPGARVKVGQLVIGATPFSSAPVPMGARQVTVEHPDRRGWGRSLVFSDTDLVSAQITLGRKSWPFWSMAALSAGAFIAGIATFVAALGDTNDLNDREVWRTSDGAGGPADSLAGTGWCTNDPGVASYSLADGQGALVNGGGFYDAAGNQITTNTFSGDECSHTYHHTTTTLLSIGSAGAVGALLYYLFFMRPDEEIAHKPRGEAISAQEASRQL